MLKTCEVTVATASMEVVDAQPVWSVSKSLEPIKDVLKVMPKRSQIAYPDGCLKLAVLNMKDTTNELITAEEQMSQVQAIDYLNYKR